MDTLTTLTGLPGVSNAETEAVFLEKPAHIGEILDAGYAATAAGDNGAINVWRDDAGHIRCEAMRRLQSVALLSTDDLREAEEWAEKWLQEIQ